MIANFCIAANFISSFNFCNIILTASPGQSHKFDVTYSFIVRHFDKLSASVCCSLFVVCCSLFIVRHFDRLSASVRCLLFVVCCLSLRQAQCKCSLFVVCHFDKLSKSDLDFDGTLILF